MTPMNNTAVPESNATARKHERKSRQGPDFRKCRAHPPERRRCGGTLQQVGVSAPPSSGPERPPRMGHHLTPVLTPLSGGRSGLEAAGGEEL
jgi:hypothetical protein